MVPSPEQKPLIARLRALAQAGPVVVAHRGNSRFHPENTVPAFASAAELGAPMQEFDVQLTADGQLVCLHDATLDRTTDAAMQLGPGARLLDTTLTRLQQLDAGSWKGRDHAGAQVPTLAAALAVMLPKSIPMIEHKAGAATAYVDELQRLALVDDVLLQSFDWQFVRTVAQHSPRMALGLLGPTDDCPRIDAGVIAAAKAIGVDLIHWDAAAVRIDDVELVHRSRLLLCTYTSDDELSWHGGRALGVDAMCTNDPGRMQASLQGRRRGRDDSE